MARRRWGLGLVTAVMVLWSASTRAQEAQDCEAVRFGTTGWLDAGAASAVAMALLRGLGYEASVQRLSFQTIFASLKNGDLDTFLEIMVPTMGAAIKPYIVDNSIELLRQNLAATKYTLAVNSHGRAMGIRRFEDLAGHADALLGEIHGVEPGADGNALIRRMIEQDQYGLGGFRLVESSEADLIVSVGEANKAGRAIVFLAFEPHPMNVRFEITYLSGGDNVFGPAYGGADVYTGIRTALAAECPNVVLLLGNLGFTLPMINEIMTAILELKARPLVAAIAWMRQQPRVLDAWLTGVTTRDGAPALPAVRSFMGLD